MTLTPKALRASYLINKSDLMRVRGLESALRADMPRAIADVLDFGGNQRLGDRRAELTASSTALAL